MRGEADPKVMMLSLVTLDQLVPLDHPIRQIKPIVDKALRELSPTFNRMYVEPVDHRYYQGIYFDLRRRIWREGLLFRYDYPIKMHYQQGTCKNKRKETK